MTDKFSETGQKVVRRAIEVSKSRDHNFLSVVHLFTALGEIESALFSETMQAVGIDPHSVTRLARAGTGQKSPFMWGKRWPSPNRPVTSSIAR